jgi:hypothetical protein
VPAFRRQHRLQIAEDGFQILLLVDFGSTVHFGERSRQPLFVDAVKIERTDPFDPLGKFQQIAFLLAAGERDGIETFVVAE